MEFFTMIGFFIAGLMCGFVVMGILAGRSYDRGYNDARNELPTDISNYLEDQI